MRELAVYRTLHEYWEELRDAFADAPFAPRPGKLYQQQLKVRSGAMAVSLVRRSVTPTSLQVRKIHNNGNNRVTKLDVAEHFADPGSYVHPFIGHLLVTPEPHKKAHGLRIVTTSDIPPEAQVVLDEGVAILTDTFG